MNETKAPAFSGYPSAADAEEASRVGFGYGSGNEAFVEGNAARVMGEMSRYLEKVPISGKRNAIDIVERERFAPMSAINKTLSELGAMLPDEAKSRIVDLQKPENAEIRKRLGSAFAQAALAVNRNPIAALGFDPRRTVMDVVMRSPTVAGAYFPKQDMIWSTLDEIDPSTIVHESVHRGIERLRQLYPEESKTILRRFFTDEESITRWLMHSLAGDPEKGGGKEGDKQRQRGINAFTEQGLGRNTNLAALEALQELAIRARKEQRPGGPR